MSIYRARWVCPITRKPRFRDFHSKREADAFRELPRDIIVLVQRVPS